VSQDEPTPLTFGNLPNVISTKTPAPTGRAGLGVSEIGCWFTCREPLWRDFRRRIHGGETVVVALLNSSNLPVALHTYGCDSPFSEVQILTTTGVACTPTGGSNTYQTYFKRSDFGATAPGTLQGGGLLPHGRR
jgi:hypothetical protein